MADGPLMPPNRRGPARPGDSAPPQPVSRPQAVSPPQAPQQPVSAQPPTEAYYPTAQLVQPVQPAVPVARPAAPPQPVYVPVAQVPVAHVPASPIDAALSQANPYVAPVAAANAGRLVPMGQLLTEPQISPTSDYSETLWEVQRYFQGMRVWVGLTAGVSALSAFVALGRGLYILYVTGGRLTPVLIGGCLSLMLSASIGLAVVFQMFGYAARMRDFLREPSRYWLEATLAAERNLWRTMGVLVIVLVFLGVTLTVALIAGMVVFDQLSR